jgi:hypothetical protein
MYSYAPFVHNGDFLVAVPTGTKPWTPETNWDGNVGKTDICGAKTVTGLPSTLDPLILPLKALQEGGRTP